MNIAVELRENFRKRECPTIVSTLYNHDITHIIDWHIVFPIEIKLFQLEQAVLYEFR